MICNHSNSSFLRLFVLVLLPIKWKPHAQGEMKTNPDELSADHTLKNSDRMAFRMSLEMSLKPEINLW